VLQQSVLDSGTSLFFTKIRRPFETGYFEHMKITLQIEFNDNHFQKPLRFFRKHRRRILQSLTLLIGIPFALYAAPLTVPNAFTAGTVVSSAQMNANFTAVATAVNDNNTRITALEAKFHPIAYGYANATGARVSGSANWSGTWDALNGWYVITITGVSYFYSSYTTVVAPASGPFTSSIGSVGGTLLITFYDAAGAKAQPLGFQFATF